MRLFKRGEHGTPSAGGARKSTGTGEGPVALPDTRAAGDVDAVHALRKARINHPDATGQGARLPVSEGRETGNLNNLRHDSSEPM